MKNPELYPLKFQPLFKYRIWGGNKLKTLLKKDYDEANIGESWEISNVEGDETEVKDGVLKNKTLKELIETYTVDFLGTHVYEQFGSNFPLLIKFIDAKTPLSIQVHPNDALAKKCHNSFGKNEMWYIMEADKEAEIIVGFEKEVSKTDYQTHLDAGTVTSILNTETVLKGDTFHIPTGRVHAIGAGVLLAEIQQTSDITYRIYDYNRVDAKTGQKRELHNDLALEAIDFSVKDSYKTDYQVEDNASIELVHTPYFKSNIFKSVGRLDRDYSKFDSFVILMCVEGAAKIEYNATPYALNYGETLLLPAQVNNITFIGTGTFLEVNL